MNFQTAIKSGFQNYANFNGRASRSAYWFWQLFSNVLISITYSIGDAIYVASALALFLPSLGVMIRRMHDTDRRGWWGLLPIANIVFACQKSDQGINRFGPPAPPVFLNLQ